MNEQSLKDLKDHIFSTQPTSPELSNQNSLEAFKRYYLQGGMNQTQPTEQQKPESAGFLGNLADVAAMPLKAAGGLVSTVGGLIDPQGAIRQAGDDFNQWVEENINSEEYKYNKTQDAKRIAEAEKRGESGWGARWENFKENPLDTSLNLLESTLPTIAAAYATGGIGALAVGAAQGAGETRKEVNDHIMQMSQSELEKSPLYQQLRQQGLTAEQARIELATSWLEHGGEIAANAVSGAVLERLGGAAKLGRFAKPTGAILDKPLVKFGTEVASEVSDEVLQQGVTNKAIQDVDSTRTLTHNLGGAAFDGMLGGSLGGAVAATDSYLRNRNEPNNDEINSIKSQETPETSKSDNTVNRQVLKNVLAGYQKQVDETQYNETFEELKNDIEEGLLEQRIAEGGTYGKLAQAYLDATNPVNETNEQAVTSSENIATQEVEQETPTDNTLNSNVKQSTPYQSNISAEDYPRFQAYLSDMQTIISLSGEEQAQKSREVQQKYGKDIELFNQEIANQFIANNPALAQELVGRVVDSETQAEQELYSRSPMKSVETNIKRGRESMNTAIAERRTVHRAMFNHDLDGWVDFEWGDIGIVKDNGKTKGAMGIAHILEARMRKDGMSYAQATKMLTDNIVETIAKGKIVDQFERNNVQNIKMDYNGYRAALRKAKGSNSWIVTAFELFEDGNSQGDGKTIPTEQQSYTARTVAGASNFVPTGEQVGSNTPNLPTQSLPTLQLQGVGAVGTNNVQQSNQQRNNQIHQDQQTLSRILGEETASHIQVVDSNTQIPSGQDVKKLVANGVEGWFEPKTQKLYIISEKIIGNDVLSRDERLAWVAWHELAHAGVRIKYGAMLKNLLESAAEHPVVNVITRRIQAEYEKDGIKISKEAAIEEAIVELYSAYQTGNWSELESRYQAKIHKSWKDGKDNVGDFLARIGNLIRRLMGVVIGRDITQTMTTSQLFDTLRGIEQGINNIAKNSQNPTANTSTNEEARYSFAGQNARNADIQQMGKARAMLSDGVDPEIVRQQTGWFKGADGKWRFELNEDPELIMPYQVYDDFRFDTEYTEDVLETTLSEVWKDSNLFEAYPHLAQRKVTIKPLNGKDGYFEPSTGEIVLSSSLSEYQMRSVLVHEVQHAIQAMEGFLNGNSPTAEIGNFTDKTFTGNSSVDTKINALQEALFQTQDPEKKANLQGQIQAYREMVAENNYFRSAGEVEARNAQTRLTMSQEERRNRSPESTEDVPRQSQILRGYRNTKVYSLNENADSDFAKAVDAVANGERTATTEIVLGTTPDVLKMLGVDEANVIMHARTLQKDMIGKHSVSAEAMKQLPKQMNDPVAVMRSRGSSTNPDAYLVLTELKEVENGKELPIIAALSFEKNANGDLELINVASAYGRKNVKVAKDLEAGTLYWHKEKGNQFLDNFSLSAESDFNLPALRSSLSDNDYLSENNIKTETDLSQYQDESSDNSTRYSKTDRSTYEQAKANGETELTFEQYQQVRTPEFKAWFGDWENDPENASKVINPKTGEPLVVYHGSNADFSVFEKTQETDYGWYGEGYYFTQDRDIADSYADMAVLERGGNQTNYGVYLNLRNPNYVNLSNGSLVTNKNSVSAKETTNKLKSQGFDGVVVFENVSGKAQGKTPYNFAEEVVAFDSNQIKSATDNNGAFDPNNNDIRYSRIKPTVLDQIQSGKIHRKEEEETLLDMVKERDFGRFWETLKSKTDRAWADEQRPVIDWLANLEKDGLISHAERVDIVNKMEAAEGVKNAKNAQMMQKYLKPLMQNIAKVAKKHNITTDQAKFWIEHYLSARWAIEKNQQYLDNEFKAMQEAETALLNAQNNGDQKQIDEASRAYRKAERQYRYRKADVESTVYGRDNDGNLLYTPKVGTAGGWSTPHAQAIMKAIEQKGLTVSEIEQAAKPMFEAIQENLLINLAANRITPEQFREFKKTPNYVPLTGDNEIDLDKDNDYIGGAGRRATNVSKDKAAKGRTQSEAEGAFDATWRMLDKTITNAAWQPFKNSIDELYETAKSEAIAQGASDKEATALAEEKTGIQKNVMKGTTRTNDDVFIRKFNNVYYEYHLPTSVMAALNGSQTSSPLNDLWGFRHAKTLTGWFARGVTQFKPMFALKNMVRDGWEKSILITTREILDNNGNDLSQKAKNQIGKEMSKLLWGANLGLNGLYKATAKFAKEGGTANLDNRKDAQGNYINKEQGYLKELIDAGGLSTYSTMLARTRKDLNAEFKRTANPKVYDGAMQLVEIWNTTFDTASSLAAYMALRENGISAERAMGVTLGLMNFRKAGAYAKHFKGFFAFMNPAIQGGKNNLQLIRTRRGQAYLVSRVAMGMLVYQLLSLMAGDDDEAGKRMDSKGDITREIIIPTPAGDIRIPVGYGAPQMAWNLSVNAMRWFNGQIPLSDAIANVVSHNVKSVVPVSPNETSAAKDPFAKVINTLAPTILKPFVELATDRNAFGNKITPSYVNEKELHATQSKSNTAQFWEDVATTMYDTFGMDAHPESYQHLFNAYRGFAGSVGDFISATIENPNRLKQGKELSIPVINDFFTIGGKGENRISILYYEGKGEMEALKKAYDYQKEHHPKTLSEWLKKGNRQQLLELNELANKRMGIIRKIKANATKDLNAKKISQEVYDKRITLYNKRVDEEQRRILYKYRTLEGLNTTKTH
ncbi:ADP-ribosyltransferase-containing protein [Ursidibacter arcticus]